jgi:hypothetical protein
MKTIEEAVQDFIKERRSNSRGYPPSVWFKAGIEFAQKWISVDDELPAGYESSVDWDGLRSDPVLVRNIKGEVFVAKAYINTHNDKYYCEFVDNMDYTIPDIVEWRLIEYS